MSAIAGGRRTVLVLVAVAVVSLAAGLGLSQVLVSPGKAAADAAPPEAGPITVPVERRVISNEVILRGDVGYEDPVGLRVETADLGNTAVVTGQVPEVGVTLDAASVALEIVGRPVIVLPGELPTYRSLRAGVSGPDVAQLKQALTSLGIDVGDAGSATYDARTAAAVRALYQRVGYEPPTAGEELQTAVTTAREAVRTAQDALGAAQRELSTASAGPLQSVLVGLDSAVAVAQATLAEAQAACAAATPEEPCSQSAVVAAQGQLDEAVAARSEAGARPDVSAQSASVRSAQQALTAAREQLATAEAATLTPLPASEVVFVPSLPRRVDSVEVRRGGTVTGEFMRVSGATVQVTATASRADADLLTVGAAGVAVLDDLEIPVTVASVGPTGTAGGEQAAGSGDGDGTGDGAAGAGDGGSGDGAGGSGDGATSGGDRRTVVFTLGALTPEQLATIQGANLRIRVPVSSTQGDVLAVPLAALTAGPAGESRVEVADTKGASHLVTVTTGLAADGFVEIAGSEEPLEEGTLVVVGVSEERPDDEPTEAEDA
ncbi:hypothetical protein [Cellulomonas fimi]|uniref:Peptidoglycan-binding domain 1 protein n=1 Tax=Cellulomonas fimi (strain ATCC 484 / DSM 20113 / JCM 1341 / CCUG 24087 / LMG 16345 / NBRC 15513 / NCIMB 8980 / NCTC 7547 / NRS-133) TaxID=590998 RepID=F4H2Q3_CELFA|nr:hypothetical protein [Cellulomonas fimi]AEE45279.1 hypothetical protein Celf_1144 [Cellulomonas fimi ATCC 484]NNH08024.1 hypothetical protein [Cellulomonas fimi]VEH28792.1 Uncharacterised protein [Cellulomonas fimi]